MHFGSAELYWECRRGIECECAKGALPSPSGSLYSTNVYGGARSFYLPAQRDSISATANNRRWRTWQMLIEQYSRLDLTRENDRLPALLGIAEEQNGTYLAGVFLEDFPDCLY